MERLNKFDEENPCQKRLVANLSLEIGPFGERDAAGRYQTKVVRFHPARHYSRVSSGD
jgi:hypothetical protein